jgi:hypothetical protein
MLTSLSARLYTLAAAVAVVVCAAAPARAQYKPQALHDPATGEKFHIEAGAGFWTPTADMTIASEGLGIAGDTIDLKKDLGLTDQRFRALQLTLRPATAHKFRLEYIPIKYDQSGTLTRTVKFNGQAYTLGLPVNSSLDWKAYRIAYEYDFVVKNQGFAGFIIEAKYTDVNVSLATPIIPTQFAHARAPIPALGGIGRFYVVPNISITGEVSGFKLPSSIDKRYGAHYVDVDIYGTVNFNNYVGAQLGYRSLDVFYLVKSDTGSLTLKGLYFGIVARY